MLRPLTISDFVPYHALRRQALASDPFSFHTTMADWNGRTLAEHERRFRHTLNQPDTFILGAWEEGEKGKQLVGMTAFERYQRERIRHKGYIWGVYLVPEQRGRGLGSKLFDTAVQRARESAGLRQIQLTVMAHNDHALRLYQSRGFQIFGHEKAAMLANGRFYDELHLQLIF